MAIGSGAEIGVTFSRWGDMDEKSRQAWFDYMRKTWGSDLVGGYATLVEARRD